MSALVVVFYWLLSMGVAGGAVGLAVMLVRRIFRLPGKYACLLWLIPAARLILPIAPGWKYGLAALVARFTTVTVPVGGRLSALNGVMAAEDYGVTEMTFKTEVLGTVFTVGAIIWAAGVAALAALFILVYRSSKRVAGRSRLLRDGVYVSGEVGAPALYGVVYPRIIIPSYLADDAATLRWAELHERTHISRRDNLTRLVAVGIACLHWFNPLAWLFLKSFLSDCELACDEAVLRALDSGAVTGSSAEYASALLACAKSGARADRLAGNIAPSFGGADTKTRIMRILSYRRLTAASALCFAAFFVTLAITLLTNAG